MLTFALVAFLARLLLPVAAIAAAANEAWVIATILGWAWIASLYLAPIIDREITSMRQRLAAHKRAGPASEDGSQA